MVKLTGALTAGVALAGCSGSPSTDTAGGDGGGNDGGGSGGSQSFDGWFEDVDNYEGVTDETGSDSVTVEVGAGTDGFAFAPPAVRVETGTTVTWEWTGKGSTHNVVADDGSFESQLVDEEGHTFEHTFDAAGTYKYYCNPHKAMGMKGVVVVE